MCPSVPGGPNTNNIALSESLRQQIPRVMSANVGDPDYDPIIQDLMKINPKLPTDPVPESEDEESQEPDDIEELSLRLHEILDILLDKEASESFRIEYEASLEEFTAHIPVPPPELEATYPRDYLSQILIDNYELLLKFCSLYFNLSLSSKVTKFTVKLFYSLQCWEIYHLLPIIPNLDYFLKLVDIDVTSTPFGDIVTPPQNYMKFNLRQGFQYPFPYPFYNFSYHTLDPSVPETKYSKVNIEPYIDIRLKKAGPKKKRRPRSWPKLPKFNSSEKLEEDGRAAAESQLPIQSPPVLKSQTIGRAETAEYQKHHKVYIFMEMSPEQIEHEMQFFDPNNDVDLDEEYDTDEAERILAEEVESAEKTGERFLIVPSTYEKVLQDAEKKGLARLTTLHQCRLPDPGTLRPCLKIFHGKNELQRHQEFVHATKKKIYRCVYCRQSGNKNQCYPRHDSLARHFRRKHGIVGRENKMAVNLAKKYAEDAEDGLLYVGMTGRLPATARYNNSYSPELVTPGATATSDENAKPLPQPPAFLSTATAPVPLQYYPREMMGQAPPGSTQDMGPYGMRRELQISYQQTGATGLAMGSTYPLPQYANFPPRLPPPTVIMTGQERSNAEEAGYNQEGGGLNMNQNFQKFRFPTNFFPVGFQPAFGPPVYGPDGRLYLNQPVQLQHMPMQQNMMYSTMQQMAQLDQHQGHHQGQHLRQPLGNIGSQQHGQLQIPLRPHENKEENNPQHHSQQSPQNVHRSPPI